MLENGFFHADPHAGNLLALPNGKLCYLDFGMVSFGSLDSHTSASIGVLGSPNLRSNFICVSAKLFVIPRVVVRPPIVPPVRTQQQHIFDVSLRKRQICLILG